MLILKFILLIPIIVRMGIIEIKDNSVQKLLIKDLDIDLFSYNKMRVLLLLIFLIIIFFIVKYYKELNSKKQTKEFVNRNIINIAIMSYIFLVIISSIMSDYKWCSFVGFPERYENIFVIIGYIIIYKYTYNIICYKPENKIIKFIMLVSIYISLIGISQLIGSDFLGSNIFEKLIIPKKYSSLVEEILLNVGENRVYATLYNPNYVGVYMGMIIPLSTTLFILRKDIKEKIFYAIVTVLSLINILGAGSKAGLLSIVFYLILLLIFFRKKIFKNWKKSLAVVLIFIVTIFGFDAYKDNHIKKIMMNAFKSFEKQPESDFKDFKLDTNKIIIVKNNFTLKMDYDDGNIRFMNENGEEIEYEVDGSKIYFENETYKGTTFIYSDFGEFLGFEINLPTNKGDRKFLVGLDDENHFGFINRVGELMYESAEAESFGFKGREKLASGRGYIWSRSIPLLKKSLIIGSGADTYALVFPQDDIIGRAKTGFNPTVIVDKPHNMYLQTAINTGVISLIALLLIYGYYIVDSFKIYFNKDEYNTYLEMAGISIFFAIMSYLFLGLSNDSVISVAPVFWVLLGMGYSINNILKQEVG